MSTSPLTRHRAVTFFQTILLVSIMVSFLALLGIVIAGIDGILFSLFLGIFLIFLYPSIDPALIARLYGARRLERKHSQILYAYLEELCRRGEIEKTPSLYLLPGSSMTAFTVGKPQNAVIILSSAMIQRLELPELVAVLAHETAHIVNHDLWLMSLTDIVSRLTALLSVVGQLLVFIFLPFYLLADILLPWAAILILITAPIISTLLQLSLSRVREYDADLTAIYLTGETRHLASALAKIDYAEQTLLERLLLPTRQERVPSLFRTHPPTDERIERLRAIKIPENITPLVYEPYLPETVQNEARAFHSLLRYLLGHWH